VCGGGGGNTAVEGAPPPPFCNPRAAQQQRRRGRKQHPLIALNKGLQSTNCPSSLEMAWGTELCMNTLRKSTASACVRAGGQAQAARQGMQGGTGVPKGRSRSPTTCTADHSERTTDINARATVEAPGAGKLADRMPRGTTITEVSTRPPASRAAFSCCT
jgi:hypothetical protein